MKIELLSRVMHGRDVYEQGDIRTVSDDLGKYFCGCGWARDVDGNVPTGERNTTEVRLAPDSVVHGQYADKVGG